MIISQYYHFFRSRRSSKVSQKGQTEYFHLILRSDSLKVTDEVDKYKKILTIWYDKMTYQNDESVLLIFVLFFSYRFKIMLLIKWPNASRCILVNRPMTMFSKTFTLFVVKMFCYNAKDIEIQVHSMALFSHPEN